MSNAPRENEIVGTLVGEQTFTTQRAIIFATMLLAAAMGAAVWIYLSGLRTLQDQPELLKQTERWVLALIGAVTVGGLVLLAMLLMLFLKWNQERIHHLIEERNHDGQKTITLLRERLKESREVQERLETQQAEIEKRAADMAASNASLQEELNKRNRSEKVLVQKRQELESSKNVLEVHVQARTLELHKLQKRYELILNSAGEGICGLDLDGKATFVNPAVARITGWQIEDLIGKTEQEIFYRNGANGHSAPYGQNLKDQVFHRKDGSTFHVEFVKTPINEEGRVVGSVLIFKDISERRRVEETLAKKATELARSNAELEQFAFVASHDLQEPLRKIQAFGDRLKVKVEGVQSAEAKDYLDRMQKAAARMQTLINDLLTFSRVIRNSQPFVQVNLGTVTREVLGDLEVRIEKSGARVEVGDLPSIDADPLQMRQLFLNLISNALKFQAPGNTPVVQIQARRINRASGAAAFKEGARNGSPPAGADEFCEISIQDNGIGFDEVYLEKIFAVFQRLHGRNEYEGTGVGLAVCRRITDRHGGAIIARSKPGQGATFLVTLPVQQPKIENNS
jgi:two-component system sensor kinase FixL